MLHVLVDLCAKVSYGEGMRKDKTDIRLDPGILQAAKERAAMEGLKVADILRRWIRKGREQEESK